MDRQIVYISQSPQDTDILNTNLDAYIGIAKLAAAVLGTSTLLNGLSCTATSPASLNVLVGAGEIYSLQNIDDTTYGSIAPDTTHQIVKQGVNLGSTTLSCPAPSTVGNSINYLVQIGFSELDTGDVVLPYYNSSNPAVPFTGPNNNPIPQHTIRQDSVNVAVKAGVSAPTGTQVTPSPDAGFTGSYVVTVAHGQTTITSGDISLYTGAPFITETLTQKLGIADLQSGTAIFATDTGSANVYAAALSPVITSYTTGMRVYIKIAHANTSTSTLNLNSLGAKTITYTSGSNIIANDLLAGMIAIFAYDGTNFQLLNPASEAAGGVLGVPEGGTGRASSTAYAIIAGGTTTTGAQQSIANGASGTMLQGAGASALSAYSTSTWPTTTTVNQILYSSSANTVTGITTANNGVLITSAGGVPSISSTIPNATQLNITALGTIATGVWNGTAITGTYIGTNTITYSNFQQVAAVSLVGNATGSLANATGITLGATLAFSGSALQTAAITGDVTASANSYATTVVKINGVTLGTTTATAANLLIASGSQWVSTAVSGDITINSSGVTAIGSNKVTVSQMAQLAAHNLLGNTTGSTANPAAVPTATFVQQVVKQVFTGSGTYTPTSGMIYCIVEGVGGGGGGGSCAGGATNNGAGAGGGAGGYGKVTLTAAQIGASKTVTIGAAGTGATAGNNAGGNGGATSLGVLLQVGGGTGGSGTAGATGANINAGGGAGGTVTTGDTLVVGQTGGTGYYSSNGLVICGVGGISYFGYPPSYTVTAPTSTTVGGSGVGYGTGGNGSGQNSVASAVAGGAGTAGYIMITEFIAV